MWSFREAVQLGMQKIIENFKHVVFNNYATFEGRARRSEYWYFVLASFLISVILSILDSILGTQMPVDVATDEKQGLISGVYSLLVLIPSIAVGVRRLHDSNKSGWWLLLPLYNLYLLIRKGTEGANRFGAYTLTPAAAPIPAAAPSAPTEPTSQV